MMIFFILDLGQIVYQVCELKNTLQICFLL